MNYGISTYWNIIQLIKIIYTDIGVEQFLR